MWYQNLTKIKSLGSQAKRPGSLAGLSEARKQHLSQFFTAPQVVEFMWYVLNHMTGKLSQPLFLFDNSIGTGSLMWPANPDDHRIIGYDVHGESVDALCEALSKNNFMYEVDKCSLQNSSIDGRVHCGIINPPFSLHLESPALNADYVCTTYGKYGPNTSAISHKYALEQSLDVAHATIAVLPMGFVDEIVENKIHPLKAVYRLPKDAFIEQGVVWPMAVCVFSGDVFDEEFINQKIGDDYIPMSLPVIEPWPLIKTRPRIVNVSVRSSEKTIPLPYTGNNKVRITHNGRDLKLHYSCGLMMAKVENHLMVSKAKASKKQRLPSYVRFSGQGCLDLEVHLSQIDPVESINVNLFDKIIECGAELEVEPGLMSYFRNKIKKLERINEPFRLSIFSDGVGVADGLDVVANKDVLVDPTSMLSPVIEKGSKVTLKGLHGGFYYTEDGNEYLIDEDVLNDAFDMNRGEKRWIVKHEGKGAAFPEQAKMWRTRMQKLKIHEWLTRDYQQEDLIETMINPTGSVCAWTMGTGKSRYGAALVQLSGVKHGLFVLKPSLIGEFIRQIKEDLAGYISMDEVLVIKKAKDLQNLKKYNFISTRLLSSLVDKKQSKVQTYAHKLRRRIGLMICDEGHFISNLNTAQTRAIMQVSARKTIVMSGTIIANYPRNIHPVLQVTAGDGTAAQPWGYYRARLMPSFIESMNTAQTGPKAFMDEYVTLEWVTHEFADGMVTGAKREIPRIKNVAGYRNMVAGFVKRRMLEEPDVAKYIKLPNYKKRDEFLDWDIDHLAFYLKVARRFADVWRQAHNDKKSIASLLPRIQAVVKAANAPFMGVDGIGSYHAITPKERRTVELVKDWSQNNHKSIVFVYNPDMADRLASHLEKADISSYVLHGGKSITSRNRMIESYKKDDVPVLIATVGTLSEGHNLEVASKVLMYSRSWSAKTEAQCYSRVLRPLQQKEVEIVFLHTRGAIDEYQLQMVSHKADSASVGIDYASPECDDEFLHMERIFGDFVEGLSELERDYINEMAA